MARHSPVQTWCVGLLDGPLGTHEHQRWTRFPTQVKTPACVPTPRVRDAATAGHTVKCHLNTLVMQKSFLHFCFLGPWTFKIHCCWVIENMNDPTGKLLLKTPDIPYWSVWVPVPAPLPISASG